ncbi:MAG TPA: hypothetical protein VF523_11180 [Burkholderiales bacterium]
MTVYAFGLTTPRNFLEKARREVGRLANISWEMSADLSVEDIQDTAINAVLTIWHVSDWIAHSTDQKCIAAIERIRIEQASQKSAPIAVLREFLRKDRNLALCETLANGAKHLTLHTPPKRHPLRAPDSQTASQGDTAVQIIRSDVTIAMAAGSAMPPILFAKIQIDNESVAALDVFHAALAYWDQFFAAYQL